MTEPVKTLGTLLGEVSAGLARIEKRGEAPQSMGGFKFVRETDVVEALKPLLDERGILIRPDVEDIRLDLYPRQGKDSPGVLATVKVAFYATRGAETQLLARTGGQGADTQDKAMGKAITAAKKQAFLIGFSIPTGDDPEATHLESGEQQQTQQRQPAQRPAVVGDNPPATDAQKRLIRAKQHEAGMSDDELAALRISATGKQSSRDFTNSDVEKMLAGIEAHRLLASVANITGGEVVPA